MRAALVGLLLAGCATHPVGLKHMPPAECRGEPAMAYEVSLVPVDQIEALCRALGWGAGNWGCVTVTPSKAWVFVPDTGDAFADLVREHEFGHVNCPDWTHP